MEGGRLEEGRGKQAAAAGVPLINGAAAVGRTWQRETEEQREGDIHMSCPCQYVCFELAKWVPKHLGNGRRGEGPKFVDVTQLCCGRSLFLYVLYRTLFLQKCSLSSLKNKFCPFLVNLLDIDEKNTLKCKIF